MELLRRIWYSVNRRQFERELQDGTSSGRAMMADARRFDNARTLLDASRDAWGSGWLDRSRQDARQAARVLRRAPGFSITAILILSVGIGLNLTFFHLLTVTALEPLAVKDPESLVRLHRRGPTFSSDGMPYPATQFIREHNDVLAAVLTEHRSHAVWEGATERIAVSFVSANWFEELGYGASLGRVFSEAIDEKADAPAIVVVSDQFWRSRLAGDAAAVGRPIRLNDRTATIIGVAPPALPDLDLQNPQVWLLIHQIEYFEPGTTFEESWNHNAAFYARLRPGVSPQAAADGLRTTLAALAQMRPREFTAEEWVELATAQVRFLDARERVDVLAIGALIGGLTLLVLIVASANLANLALSQAIGRLHEWSVRAALGASRRRIKRHILVECALLAVGGAAGGLAIGHTGARLLAAFLELPPYYDFGAGPRLFAAALVAAFVAMLPFGLAPAWIVSRRDLLRAMKDGGHQTSASLARTRFRLLLVGAQVLGCCALLVVAGALARGLQQLLIVDPGFRLDRVVLADVSLDRHGITGAAARAYWSQVIRTVATHPEVERLSLVYPLPLGRVMNTSGYGSDSGSLGINVLHVDPAFFDVLEIPLIAGRTFKPGDERSAVIISRRVALRMYGTLDVIGKGYPRTDVGGPMRTIIGVAGDASIAGARATNSAEEYMLMTPTQMPGAALFVRSRTDPRGLLAPLRAAASGADARVLAETRLLIHDYQARLRGSQLAGTIAALIAGLVLTLACLGIFGVVSHAVKVRTKEIGIRRALGADASHVYLTLLRQLAWPVAAGMLLGTAAGIAASIILGRKPFYLAIADGSTSAAAFTLFAVAALVAALVPASRALRPDPIEVLRHE